MIAQLFYWRERAKSARMLCQQRIETTIAVSVESTADGC
jgi:hypothetical protein